MDACNSFVLYNFNKRDMSTRIQFLQDQFQQSRKVMNSFLNQVPVDKWFVVVGQPESNIAWHCAEMELVKLNLGLGFKWQ